MYTVFTHHYHWQEAMKYILMFYSIKPNVYSDIQTWGLKWVEFNPNHYLKRHDFWLHSKVNGTPALIGHCADPEGRQFGRPS